VFSGSLTIQQLLAFSGLALLITLLPGPDTALVIRAAMRSGRTGAIKTAAGICSGLLVWGCLTAGGLTAFLTSFPTAYRVIAFLGGLYLLYLGWHSWKFARFENGVPAKNLGNSPYASGLITNLLNPKIAVFYLSVLPHFAPPGPFLFARALTLATIHAIFGMFWFTIVGVFIERSLLSQGAVKLRMLLQRITAVLLAILGLRILLGG